MTTAVQKYLREGGTLAALLADLGIKSKRHNRYPNLVLLKYSQIDSPKGDLIVRECRGLILDEANDWAVASRPLNRFFNASEFYADVLDPASTRAYEKLDGSLICMYYYDGHWQEQTSGTPDASGEVGQSGMTFSELFVGTWAQHSYVYPEKHWRNVTFIFELTGPLNQVVVQYETSQIRLLAVRFNSTGEELDSEGLARKYGWEHAKRFDPNSLDLSLPASSLEGYILVDRHCKRVKVKHCNTLLCIALAVTV